MVVRSSSEGMPAMGVNSAAASAKSAVISSGVIIMCNTIRLGLSFFVLVAGGLRQM